MLDPTLSTQLKSHLENLVLLDLCVWRDARLEAAELEYLKRALWRPWEARIGALVAAALPSGRVPTDHLVGGIGRLFGDRWPLGRGFERFYGFFSGETHQFAPALISDNQQIRPPRSIADGYHLTEDLVDQSIGLVRDLRAIDTDKPFLLYLATGACHSPRARSCRRARSGCRRGTTSRRTRSASTSATWKPSPAS